MIIETLATIMGIIGSFAFYPQLFKIIKRKSSADISVLTYYIGLASCIVWLIYAIKIISWPLIITNIFVCIAVILIIIFYYVYKK